jgi:hypothetical protein
MGIVMLAWPRPWIKKPKPIKKELVIPWKQLIFYILAVICFFLALSSGLINFIFWTLGFVVFSLWWSGGWFFLKKDSNKSRVLKVYIPTTLYHWIAEPFIAWEKINKGIYTSEISYKRVMKGVFIFGISIFLLIIAMVIYYVLVN